MFESLYSKTFALLTLQLTITWIATVYVIAWFKEQYLRGKPGVMAQKNENGQLDLVINFDFFRPYTRIIFICNIIVFALLFAYGRDHMVQGVFLFSLWSILTGIELALCLINVDENIGKKVLAITASITALASVIGMFGAADLHFMGLILFAALSIVLTINVFRLLAAIPRIHQRITALFGCIVFFGYLLFDFNRLAAQSKVVTNNTWEVAMNFSIDIYLDIVNLFLELLDLLSN